MKARALILTFFIFSINSFLYAQNNELKIRIDSYFEKYVFSESGDTNTPGVSIVITKQNQVLYMGNYGAADLENNIPVSENTIFDLASVSKQFTGMAIALLEEEGKLSASDKIVKYIPGLPAIMNDITIDQLLHHSSGIRDWPILMGLQGKQMEEPITTKQIFDLIKRQKGLNFPPGTSHTYSNSNYNLLVKIIEKVSDTTINFWMQKNIFTPLEMNNTFYVEDPSISIENEAKSYANSGNEYVKIKNNLLAPGSSSLRSNILDMSRWMLNFHSKGIGGDKVFDRITQKGKLNDGKPINYGYGIFIAENNGEKIFIHDGSWAGFKTGTAYLPEEGIGIVVLSNNAFFQTTRALKDISEIILPKAEKNDPVTAEKPINDGLFGLFAGKYEQVDDKGTFLTFYKEKDEYFLNFNDLKILKLYARSDTVLFIKEVEAEFIFHLEDGEVNSHSLHQNGRYYKAIKVQEKQKKQKIKHKKFIGAYYSNELDIKYKVIFKKKMLLVQIPAIPFSIVLKHSNDLSFEGNTGLIQSLTFIEKEGKIEGFVIDNPRAKGMFFKKLNK